MALVLSTAAVPCLMSRLCGAKRIIGFDNDWARRLIGERVAFEAPPSLGNSLRMAQYLCPDPQKTDYLDMLAPTDADHAAIRALLSAHGVAEGQTMVVLAPFASARRSWKCWPLEYFGQVAAALHEEAGLLPVVVGAGRDKETAEQLLGDGSVPGISLVGQTDLGLILALLQQARAYIGIDSGLTHLSAALRCPTLAIFGPTDPRLSAPMGEHTRTIYHDLACSPCHNRAARCRNRECLLGISPEEVITQVLALL